ncbi:hypothetical protein [Sphingomonas sp. NPDC079357]|uniref:hypothetical protein n=1 Tax=Sphingomonas sp. NPDC079357 TaxID=3364518 RepID=UPI0038512824
MRLQVGERSSPKHQNFIRLSTNLMVSALSASLRSPLSQACAAIDLVEAARPDTIELRAGRSPNVESGAE